MKFLFLLLLLCATPALAVEPGEMLKDTVLETRARHISKDLRCLVCQGEAIDDSSADIAKDIRILVRRRLQAGDSDEQVKEYLRSRYGDFILLTPPVEGKTLLLWLTPVVMLGGGILVARRFLKD